MLALSILLSLGSLVAASRPGLHFGRDTYSGTATFNNYASQSNTVCGPMAGMPGTYGAAASSISPDISGGACYAQIDFGLCSGQSPVPGYEGPACPTSNCGLCYQVVNNGGYGGSPVGGIGSSVIVQIIDSCPTESAWNFCKTDIPANERCGDSGTNQLDIDQSAYLALTGTGFGGGMPNLEIGISPIPCP